MLAMADACRADSLAPNPPSVLFPIRRSINFFERERYSTPLPGPSRTPPASPSQALRKQNVPVCRRDSTTAIVHFLFLFSIIITGLAQALLVMPTAVHPERKKVHMARIPITEPRETMLRPRGEGRSTWGWVSLALLVFSLYISILVQRPGLLAATSG